MPTTIESLELEILSSSTSAESGLDKLSKSLEKLKQATSGGIGLTAVAKQIKALDNAAKSIDQGSVDNLNGIARAINTLSNLGGVKLSSTIATQITAIGNAARTLDGVNFSPLSSLASSLGQFGTIGNINLNPTINQLSRIPELTNKLSTVDTSGFSEKIREITEALRPLSEMPKQNISSTLTQLKKLPDIANSLNGIDMSAFNAKIQEVADALRPLADEMANVAAGFSAFPARIQRLISTTNSLSRSNGRAANSYINLYAKLKMAATAVKGIASKIASSITKMNDYIENVNLFTASMREYSDEASRFAENVGAVMGIDPGEWMRNQGVFMTLATGFGIAGDRAYTMSQQLTQLGYDLSSFFNISYEEAMQKLQSGISGELEPLRRLGYDLSQAKLQSVALSLGIDKAVSSMTQAEKAQLRYYAIMTQVTTAHGDMARTLEAPANQMRILKAQVAQAARAIGSIFIPALNAVLPYIIATVEVIRYLASTIASLFGFKMPEIDYSGLGNITSGADNASGALDDATESAKKLKSYMLGFDELNVINPNEGQGASAEDILGQFDFELPTYNFIEGVTESRVAKIVEEIKEWLGLTEDIDSWSKLMKTRFGKILKSAAAIGTAIAAWKITDATINAIKTLNTLMKNPSIAITVGVTLMITGFSAEFSGIENAIEEGLDSFNFIEIVGNGLLGVGGAALLGGKIAGLISKAFSSSAVTAALTKAASNLGLASAGTTGTAAASAAGAALSAGIAGIVAGIPMYIVGIYNALKDGIDWMSGALIGIGATVAGAGIGTIIGACGGPLTAGIGALIGLAVGLITDFTTWFWQKFDEIEKWFKGLPNWLQNIMPALGLVLGGVFSAIGAVITLIKKWDELWAVYGTAWNKFSATWVSGFDVIKTEFEKFFTKTIPDSWNAFWATWDSGFKEIQTFFEGIGTAMIDGIVEGWQTIWTAITEFVDGFVQGFKDALGIHSPSKVFEEIGVFMIEGLLNGMLKLLGNIGNWCKTNIIDPFKRTMDGALTFSVGVKNNASTWWSNVQTWWNKSVGTLSASVSLSKGWSSLPSWLTNLSTSLKIKLPHIGVNWIDTGFMDVKYPKFSVSYYAKGGFPDMGQIFIAREAGPELVGSIGNKNAVVNNDQIVESVSAGVYQAVIAALGSNGDEGGDTQIVINLDGEKIYENQQKIARGRGYNLGMGVFSFG